MKVSTPFFNFSLAIISFSCWLIAVCTFYPGYIWGDAGHQFAEASGILPITDGNPPFVTWLWQAEIYILHTGNLWNATITLCLCAALYILFLSRKKISSLFLFVILFFSPIFFTQLGSDYKDYFLAYLVLLSFSLWYTASKKEGILRKNLLISAFSLLIIASFCRINAPFITAPLMAGIICTSPTTYSKTSLKIFPYFLSVLSLIIAFLTLTPLLNKYLFKAQPDHMGHSLEIFDLGGISFWSKQNLFPGKYTKEETQLILTPYNQGGCYDPTLWDGYYFSSHWWDPAWPYNVQNCPNIGHRANAEPEILHSAWKKAIINHPLSYLKHRYVHYTQGFLRQIKYQEPTLGTWDMHKPGYYINYLLPQSKALPPPAQPSSFFSHYANFMKKWHCQPWFYPSTWLALTCFLFIYSFKNPTVLGRIIHYLSFASLTYLAGYAIFGVASDYRYCVPSEGLIIAALIVWENERIKLGSLHQLICGLSVGCLILLWSFLGYPHITT